VLFVALPIVMAREAVGLGDSNGGSRWAFFVDESKLKVRWSPGVATAQPF
jgi:hypothetical protein